MLIVYSYILKTRRQSSNYIISFQLFAQLIFCHRNHGTYFILPLCNFDTFKRAFYNRGKIQIGIFLLEKLTKYSLFSSSTDKLLANGF